MNKEKWFDNVTSTDWLPNTYSYSTDYATTLPAVTGTLTWPQQWESLRMDFTRRIEENENLTPAQREKALTLLNEIKKARVEVKEREADERILSKKAQLLERLGLKKAAEMVKREADRFFKEVLIATHGYTKIPFEKLEEYKNKLESGFRLIEIPLAEYPGIPPTQALEKLEMAQKQQIFDEFAILTVQKVPDPILVGKIKESKDLYFICEWGSDLKLEDILKEK